ncbi:MAG: FHA domain-containing protein, partial [Polyangiaceae bacterium]
MLEEGRAVQLPALRVSVAPGGSGSPVEALLGVDPVVIGTGLDCDLRVTDPRMSRRHCEVRLTERGVRLRDLGSKNGVLLGEVPVVEVYLPPLTPVRLGGSTLIVTPEDGARVLPLSALDRFGDALGKSLAMRAMFALLERAAPTDETVLLLGESGT